jgi:hypothetical protein
MIITCIKQENASLSYNLNKTKSIYRKYISSPKLGPNGDDVDDDDDLLK